MRRATTSSLKRDDTNDIERGLENLDISYDGNLPLYDAIIDCWWFT